MSFRRNVSAGLGCGNPQMGAMALGTAASRGPRDGKNHIPWHFDFKSYIIIMI
jgi:hypothetical protein